MKTIFKYFLICVALGMGLTSCREDYEIPATGDLDHSEQLVAGTYSGTWSRINTSTNEEESQPGTLTFAPGSSNNVCSMTVSSTLDLGLSSDTSVCNISRNSSNVFNYWNTTASNPFGMTFTGKIYGDINEATMAYVQKVKVGRKEVIFNYSFSGIRQ